jgi:hypothetical protein
MRVTGNVVPAHTIEVHKGNSRIALYTLDIGRRKSLAVNFTLRPLSRLEETSVTIEWEAEWDSEPV